MRGNRGQTSLKLKRRTEDPMRDYDRLPPELRAWLAEAVLPWRPRSVRRAFDRAVARTRNRARALEELDRLQERLVAKDARAVWGDAHPCVSTPGGR
ncbi:DUF6525 family protein [Roseovarius salis]|uniref:DUF6525 family protein n=1 Tax=Roseovarius salis TaxID=3376063 RepID=UPI0037C63CD7